MLVDFFGIGRLSSDEKIVKKEDYPITNPKSWELPLGLSGREAPATETMQQQTQDVNTANNASASSSNQQSNAGQQPGMVWRMSSGLYNTATGAVGLGVGGVKWVVGVGSSVVSHVPVPGKLKWKTKDKSE